jgi:hypothetical protein
MHDKSRIMQESSHSLHVCQAAMVSEQVWLAAVVLGTEASAARAARLDPARAPGARDVSQ